MASTSRAVCVLIFTLALCEVTAARTLSADPTPRERVQQAFKEITTLSDNLRIDTQKINLINAPLQGYKIAQGFAGIIAKISDDTARLPDPSTSNAATPFDDADAKLVVAALTDFVRVHQALLNVVIGKHGLLTLIPFFEPIRQALVGLEATVDTFAYKLIAMIPTEKSSAENQFASLAVTVQLAISTYEEPLRAVAASPLAAKLVQALKDITTLSDNLRVTTQRINLVNAPLDGGKIAQGFAGIVTTIAQVTAQLEPVDAKSALGDDDAKVVVAALTTFVQVHQALLNVVIGKHGLITLVPFFEPIRYSLVNLEAVVDAFAYALIELIPSQKAAVDAQFGALGVTVQMAIRTYDQPLLSALW